MRKGASAYSPEDWIAVRDQAVFFGQLVQAFSIEQLEAAIQHGERALSVGPILDPTAARHGGGELQKHLRYLRALLAFRRAVAETIGATA